MPTNLETFFKNFMHLYPLGVGVYTPQGGTKKSALLLRVLTCGVFMKLEIFYHKFSIFNFQFLKSSIYFRHFDFSSFA